MTVLTDRRLGKMDLALIHQHYMIGDVYYKFYLQFQNIEAKMEDEHNC